MSKRVYSLKHATPKMKYHHMNMVLAWRDDLKEKQAKYEGEGNCPICKKPIQSRPLFMVGEYDYCYSCYRSLELHGIQPVKNASEFSGVLKARRAAIMQTFQNQVLKPAQVIQLTEELAEIEVAIHRTGESS